MPEQRVDTIPAEEVAAALGTSFEVLKAMIQNGTMPIGGVGHKDGSSRDRVIIPRSRWEAYRDALDMKPGA